VREEATAPIAAAAAATKNNEQKIRRNCDGMDVGRELLVIGFLLHGAAYAAPCKIGLDFVLVTCGYPLPNVTVTWFEQFPVPASHTLYV
jgi:hypothetical protein